MKYRLASLLLMVCALTGLKASAAEWKHDIYVNQIGRASCRERV